MTGECSVHVLPHYDQNPLCVLISISPNNNAEHFLMCLLVFGISCFKKYLFKSLFFTPLAFYCSILTLLYIFRYILNTFSYFMPYLLIFLLVFFGKVFNFDRE